MNYSNSDDSSIRYQLLMKYFDRFSNEIDSFSLLIAELPKEDIYKILYSLETLVENIEYFQASLLKTN